MASRAHKIGSLLFCPNCGTLLSLPRDGEKIVTCEQCSYEEPASSYENVIITTKSDPEAFPSALRQKRKTQTKHHDTGDKGTLVSEKCPVCGHLEAYSKEMQLRSADEGSTIFYTCNGCQHKWRVNN
ncbi:DNA-directed RNA polymerase I subunit RPA12 [Psilocybe cubensis]|uniref:DNA-directed RNA polymerase I subunit RPA12 n=1 Tax=Psilocybe cubensis TaxID=181762 RepID=A0ACB8HHL1_PSICU|nr:DNA-directed RNA polymerase I subunit RPA12 [Psilocybe cubensis]KAH9487200.1 DNA-directed RNA polymerase I subunit RPA12 [Psilocybe cubensis]